MKNAASSIVLTCLIVVCASSSVFTHHSAAVAYDLDKYLTLEGVVTQ